MPDPGSSDQTIPVSQAPTASVPAASPPPRPALAHLAPGTVVSRYRIESVLGEGGMGTVYLARQEKPDRQVALKVVRPGYATERMLRRFEMEAEVLGRLLHPGIAQIYEAGTADAGAGPQPFFAMELVTGVPLTRYAHEKGLSTRERLELVARVCDAVQHAHQKGVIHRDLKPGNILVTEEGQPKILDFGVARATDSDIQQTTMETDVGAIIGTIPYMSPEQVGGDPAELDTRSDVYALGVIAYELLVGRLPYSLEHKMIHEAARIIREEEPTRLSSIDRALRGDVETIVAHALEKDKARRYGAASALAADIRRHLSDEPIAARPASTWYQVTKFSRRNKGLVAGVALAFAFLAAGLAFALVSRSQAVDAREAEFKARASETWERTRADERADAAEKAEKAESARADELKQVSEFHDRMLRQIDAKTAGADLMKDVRERFAAALEAAGVPEAERGAQTGTLAELLLRVNATDTAAAMIDRTLLQPAAKTIDAQFKDQPAVDAQLRQALADQYESIGLYDAAYPLQKQAMDTRRRVLGEEHPDTLASIRTMGILLIEQGRLAEAEPYCRESLEKSRRVLGAEHPSTLDSFGNMGSLLEAQGKLAEAEPYYRETVEKRRRVLGEAHPSTLTSINNLGFLLQAQGKFAEAEPYFRDALQKRRQVLGEEHPSTLASMSNMGQLLGAQGRFAEAEPYCRESLEKSRRVLGEEHPDTLILINNLGTLLQKQGKLAEAEPYCRKGLERYRRVLGEKHPHTLVFINNLSNLLRAQGKLAEAEPYMREALEGFRRVLGEEHPQTLTCVHNMAFLLQDQGKLVEAELYFREAMEKRRRVLGEEHPKTLDSISDMGYLLYSQSKYAEAEPYWREALEKSRRVLGEEHPDTLSSISNMGALLRAQGKLAEAEPYWREALEKRRRLLGEEHLDTLTSINNIGVLLCSQGKCAEAEALLLPAAAIAETRLSVLVPVRVAITNSIASLYSAWDMAEPGKGHDAKAAEWKAKLDALTPLPDPVAGDKK